MNVGCATGNPGGLESEVELYGVLSKCEEPNSVEFVYEQNA